MYPNFEVLHIWEKRKMTKILNPQLEKEENRQE
jgi:hypothetical protein